mgnify:CR=1 FL=1
MSRHERACCGNRTDRMSLSYGSLFSVDGIGQVQHDLTSGCNPKKIGVRYTILPLLVFAMAVLALACQPDDSRSAIKFSEGDMDSWRTKEINLLESDAADAQGRRIFSVKMPIGWDIRHARPRPNSWSGQLVGQEFTLDFQGGPKAVSVLDDIVGRGSLDEQKAAAHLITEEVVEEGAARTFVRPQDGGNGVTGMIMDLADTQLLIAGREMSADQQDIALAVFRTITP